VSRPPTQFKVARVERDGMPVALVTIDNGEDYTTPSTFGRAAFESLARALDELERDDWAALVLTGKPFVFAAGADLEQFPLLSTPDLAREASRIGHELFGRLAALPFPTVAAINGACLGGGVEIALHCGARTISSAVRHFACPECFLGIIPAWGGTQLVPRLVGAEAAVTFVVSNPMRQNRMLDGRTAFELGFADRLLEPVEFVDESLAFALELAQPERLRPVPRQRDAARMDEAAEDVIRKARARLDGSIHGAAPAPYRALDLIEGALSGWSLEEGYRAEEEALAELLPSRQAQASLYAYDVVERRARRGAGRPEAEPRSVRKVAIVGAGLMATQLAWLFLRRLEVPIVLRDVREEALAEARATIGAELEAQVQKGRYDEGKSRFLASLLATSTGYDGFGDCDLVLEAVFEELAVKKRVFAELEDVVSSECALATNTSALSVTEMAADLRHPERVVGMHFFNPVAVLPLVELVRATATDDATLATAWWVADRLGKRAVLVEDAPAFVVNRVLTRLTSVLLEAIERGTPVATTDDAILRLGLPMAPSVLLQMVGPAVANHVLHTLHEAYPDRFRLSQTLENYARGSDEIARVADEPQSEDEVLESALEAVADEIRHLLDERVVASAADVDAALILGAGWPFWLGGITKYLDQTGISGRVAGVPLSELRAATPA
jgi:3-hydroxyacyl-CoA dehydrogenase/enoyl-CoA hydratase/carnithine racemase